MRDEHTDGQDGSQLPDDGVAADDSKPARRRPPAAGRVTKKAPPAVLEQRVARVATLMVRGLGRSLILQVIARDQRDEIQKRTSALASGSDRAEAEQLSPVVWGDDPVPERTVDTYIAKAKTIISAETKSTVVKHREYAAGVVLARYGDLYALAIEQKKLSVARNVLVDLCKILGVKDIVSMMQLADANAQSQAEKEKAGTNLSTEKGRADAFSALLDVVRQRDPSALAKFAKMSETPTNGNGNNGDH